MLEGQFAGTTFRQAVNGAEDRLGQPQSDRGLTGGSADTSKKGQAVNGLQGKGQPFGDRVGPRRCPLTQGGGRSGGRVLPGPPAAQPRLPQEPTWGTDTRPWGSAVFLRGTQAAAWHPVHVGPSAARGGDR